MSDRVVGLLDGYAVYEDGHGGYEADVRGQRVAIKLSFHSHIKFCFEHHDAICPFQAPPSRRPQRATSSSSRRCSSGRGSGGQQWQHS